jgi:hypothetical protein
MKGRELNCQFDSRPLKVKNHPNLLVFRWRVTYHWKVIDKVYNFSLNLISVKGLHKKLWASKVTQFWEFRDSQVGSPKTKWHLGAGPMARHWEYYKGEGGGFLQVQVVVNLMSPCSPVARHAPKMLQLCIDQLVIWFVLVCVSNFLACPSS